MFVGGTNMHGGTVSLSYFSHAGKAAGGYTIITTIKSSLSIIVSILSEWLVDIQQYVLPMI